MKRLSVLTLTAVLLLGVVGITGAEEVDVYIEVGKYASLTLEGPIEVRLSLPEPEASDAVTISFVLKSNAQLRLTAFWDDDFRNQYFGLLHMSGRLWDREGNLIRAGGSWLHNFEPGKHDLDLELYVKWVDVENPEAGYYWWQVEPGEIQTTYTLIVEAL